MDSSTSVTLFCQVFVSLLCNANWFRFVGPFGKFFTFNNMIFLLMRLLLFNDAESWTFFSGRLFGVFVHCVKWYFWKLIVSKKAPGCIRQSVNINIFYTTVLHIFFRTDYSTTNSTGFTYVLISQSQATFITKACDVDSFVGPQSKDEPSFKFQFWQPWLSSLHCDLGQCRWGSFLYCHW